MNRAKPTTFKSVSRVAEQLLLALIRGEEAPLVTSTRGWLNLQQARDWLVRQGHGPIVWPCPSAPPGFLSRRERLWREEANGRLAALVLGACKEAIRLETRLRGAGFRPLPRLAAGDLFVSPLLPVPRAARRRRSARRALLLHDLFGLTHPHLTDPFFHRMHRELADCLHPQDLLLANSSSTRDHFLSFRPDFDPARAVVVPLAAEAAFYPRGEEEVKRVRARCGLPPGEPYLLSVAQLDRRKNLPLTVRAFRRLLAQERVPGVRLVLAGGVRPRTEEGRRVLAEAAASGGRVVTTGFVEESDLPALYSGATGFVFPSLAEGFGLPPLEAMACGAPVLTSSRGSLPEVTGDAALLVDPEDEEAVAEGMFALATDGSLRQRLREKGLARAALFTWERFRAQTLDAARAALE